MGIILCFLPLIVALVIFTFGFKLNFFHQIVAVLIGLLTVIPISFIQFFLPDIPFLLKFPLWNTLFKSLVIYGFVEELIKMFMTVLLPHKKSSTLQFLFLAFLMGISLGCFESVVYFLDHLQKANAKGAQLLYSQIFMRIFTSDIIHLTCAGLGGLFVVSCRQKKAKISLFIFSVMLHGFYDFFAGFANFFKYFSIIVIFLAIAECRIKYLSLKQQ